MILAIRTDSPTTYLALINDGAVTHEENWESGRELAKNLLTKIAGLCSGASISIQDINGVIYFKGPGSFTGLRIGGTVANTLAYSLHIPIVGTASDHWLAQGIKKLQEGSDEKIIIPEYGSDAHITL